MIDKLRALWLSVSQQRTAMLGSHNDVLAKVLRQLTAAGFGPGTSTAADEIERLTALALHSSAEQFLDDMAAPVSKLEGW